MIPYNIDFNITNYKLNNFKILNLTFRNYFLRYNLMVMFIDMSFLAAISNNKKKDNKSNKKKR